MSAVCQVLTWAQPQGTQGPMPSPGPAPLYRSLKSWAALQGSALQLRVNLSLFLSPPSHLPVLKLQQQPQHLPIMAPLVTSGPVSWEGGPVRSAGWRVGLCVYKWDGGWGRWKET